MATSLTLQRFGFRRRSDDDVFALALDGDEAAFSEVYRRYNKRIYGYCLACLMDPEAAADAAQEVFTRFLKAPREGIEKPRAWLFAVARNVTIDSIRKRDRAPIAADTEVTEGAMSTSAPDAADEFLGQEDARNIFIALRKLRPRYRTALILREIHHQSSADMADAFDTTTGAVDTLVSRARDAFGRMYGEVSGLPSDCRDAVAAIYKRKGTGLDDAEESRLESHLASCTHCQTEAKRAARLDGLSAMLPFLIPSGAAGHNLFQRAVLALNGSPDLAAKAGYLVPADRMTPAVKLGAGLLALTLFAGAGVATVETHRGASTTPPAAVASVRKTGGGTTPSQWRESWASPYASWQRQMNSYSHWDGSSWMGGSSHDAWSGSGSNQSMSSTDEHSSGSGSTSHDSGWTHSSGGSSSSWSSHTSDSRSGGSWSDSHSGSSDSTTRHW